MGERVMSIGDNCICLGDKAGWDLTGEDNMICVTHEGNEVRITGEGKMTLNGSTDFDSSEFAEVLRNGMYEAFRQITQEDE